MTIYRLRYSFNRFLAPIEFDWAEEAAPVHSSDRRTDRREKCAGPPRLPPDMYPGVAQPAQGRAGRRLADARRPPRPRISGQSSGATGAANQRSPEEELAGAREVLIERAEALALLDDELAPVRAAEKRIRDAIVHTHHHWLDGGDPVLVDYDRNGIEARRPLFAELTELSIRWGPTRTQRTALNREVKALERHVEHLRRLIQKSKKKERTA